MSALFLELARTVLFLTSPLAPHGEVAKGLPVVRLAIEMLLLSVDSKIKEKKLKNIHDTTKS